MSHTHKDQPGGHVATFLKTNGGDCWNTPSARRFGKKFHAREARREAKRITRAAIIEADAEREWLERCREECEAELYDEWEDENAHCDDYGYDPHDDYYEWEY